jgi:carboxymethylenebutenolidase
MRTEEHAFGFLARPEGGGARPGVVAVPDVWGLSSHIRAAARRLAGEGFAVLAVDPYRRTGRGAFADAPGALAWIRELDDLLVLDTIQEAIDALAAHPAVAGRPVGITGFCMGGQYAILAACRCRGLAACAPFYGMLRYEPGLDPARKPRSPLDAVADLACPLLGFYGTEDPLIPVSDVEALRARLAASGQPGEVRLYAGAGHAFANETRPESYRPEAAADAWRRLVAFLHERLG